MTRHRLYRDDTLVYDFTDTAPVTPPVQPPVTPPTQPPPGNPGAIVPPWGAWDQVYPGRGFTFQNGQVYAFPVPVQPNMPALDGVTFTVGQTPSQAPQVGFELCLSRTPGEVTGADPGRYWATGPEGFQNSIARRIYQMESGWNHAGTFKGFPQEGQWYLNVRAWCPSPSIHSIQWAS